MEWLKKLFKKETAPKTYWMLIPYKEGSVWLGGYKTHPFTKESNAPFVCEFDGFLSITEVREGSKVVCKEWLGVEPKQVHLSSSQYPLRPLSNGGIQVVILELDKEPQNEHKLERKSLSDLAIVGDSDLLNFIMYQEVKKLASFHQAGKKS